MAHPFKEAKLTNPVTRLPLVTPAASETTLVIKRDPTGSIYTAETPDGVTVGVYRVEEMWLNHDRVFGVRSALVRLAVDAADCLAAPHPLPPTP